MKRTIRLVLATFALLTVIVPVAAARADAGSSVGVSTPGGLTPVYAGPSIGQTQVGSDAARRARRSATIQVTYSGFTTAAKTAFQAAVDIWETKLDSSVAIKIQANWTNLGNTGILGSAGPVTFHGNFSGAEQQNVWYPAAIANKLHGSDLDATNPDIEANFNNQFPNWYFGTTGPTPANKYDFESVVLHEIGHGIGFLLSFRQSGSQIIHGLQGFPLIQDGFATNSSGQKANRFPSGSTDFKNAVTGNNLFWNGNKGKAGQRRQPPEALRAEPVPTRQQRVAPRRGDLRTG